LCDALTSPIRQICHNTGVDAGDVLGEVRRRGFGKGYNAHTGQYVNMWDAGIIVPTKVERVALENAISVASLLLTTDCMLCPEDAAILPT
jgi:chaperonin GroEL